MSRTNQEWLELFLSGYMATPDDANQLIRENRIEDLFLDYKHGNELLDRKKAANTIRCYTSGFANSVGGVLVIGVDESSWTITGCVAPGGGDLAQWASRCLTPIAPYLSPPPRIHVVKHPEGDVLIITTSRSPSLVPSIENGEISYYLRFHDQTLNNKTLRVPDYLIGDIVLGRRQQPSVQISEAKFSDIEALTSSDGNFLDVRFRLHFTIENQSLIWTEDTRIGSISWVKHAHYSPVIPMSNHLQAHLDFSFVDEHIYKQDLHIAYQSQRIPTIEAFHVVRIEPDISYIIPMRSFNSWYTYTWRSAVYIISKTAPPVWYQLSIVVDDNFLKFARKVSEGDTIRNPIIITRTTTIRPEVAWSELSIK